MVDLSAHHSLADTLGEVLCAQESTSLFEAEEKVRAFVKSRPLTRS
jgi:hypothetical protein